MAMNTYIPLDAWYDVHIMKRQSTELIMKLLCFGRNMKGVTLARIERAMYGESYL